jgi:hypothetical protein
MTWPVEILRDARRRGHKTFLAEEPHEQIDCGRAQFACHGVDFRLHGAFPSGSAACEQLQPG